VDLRAEVVIDAPAAAAWAVLGAQFGDIGQWAVPILGSSLDGEPGPGAVRTCQIAAFGPFAAGEIKERLVQFDPVGMALAYESAAGMSSFVRYAVNRWSVQPETEDRCMVRTHATLELSGPVRLLAPLLKRKLEGDGARVLEELRYRVERGCPHPRKLAAA
jgi:hypothetical protein